MYVSLMCMRVHIFVFVLLWALGCMRACTSTVFFFLCEERNRQPHQTYQKGHLHTQYPALPTRAKGTSKSCIVFLFVSLLLLLLCCCYCCFCFSFFVFSEPSEHIAFSEDCLKAVLDAYPPIVAKHKDDEFTEQQKQWQLMRRGR